MLGLPAAVIVESIVIEAAGGIVQGSLGFGINLLAVPLLEVVDPGFVPVAVLLAGMASGLMVAIREPRAAVDWRGVWWAIGGTLPGSALGAGIVLVMSKTMLELSTAGLVIVGVLVSLVGWRVRVSRPSMVGIGVASGIMGSVAGLGGVGMGLMYQDASGTELRATLATYNLLGATAAVSSLALVGRIGWDQILFASVLLPGVIGGFLLSGPLRVGLDRGGLRPAVLGIIGLASIGLVVQVLW